MKKCLLNLIVLCLAALHAAAQDDSRLLQFVFTSDVHYGLTRPHFRGDDSVPSVIVNRAMIDAINNLPGQSLPDDGAAGAGRKIGHVDGLMITGDIANRQEAGIQSASISWDQFESDYFHRLDIHTAAGKPTPVCVLAGNHDLADAMGNWRPMIPARDNGSLVGMYNRMIAQDHPIPSTQFDYVQNVVHYSRDWRGIHAIFVNLWPDSAEREWINQDLAHIPPGTPVLLFTHTPPEAEARLFVNPKAGHSINTTDKFENLLQETFKDGDSIEVKAAIESQALATFLEKHPAIRAWFHGHNNWTEYYTWTGPKNDIHLPVFRVDSPMKGKYSNKDEKQLSFQLITIDPHDMSMTVRECLWNTKPSGKPQPIIFHVVHSISLTR